MNKIFFIVGMGIRAGAVLGHTARELRRRKDRRELNEDAHRWENEGGHVPAVGTARARPQ